MLQMFNKLQRDSEGEERDWEDFRMAWFWWSERAVGNSSFGGGNLVTLGMMKEAERPKRD